MSFPSDDCETRVNPRVGLFLIYGDRQHHDLLRGDVSAIEIEADAAKARLLEEFDAQFEAWLHSSTQTSFKPQLSLEFRSVVKEDLRPVVEFLVREAQLDPNDLRCYPMDLTLQTC